MLEVQRVEFVVGAVEVKGRVILQTGQEEEAAKIKNKKREMGMKEREEIHL